MRKLKKSELNMVSGSLDADREKEIARDLTWNASSIAIGAISHPAVGVAIGASKIVYDYWPRDMPVHDKILRNPSFVDDKPKYEKPKYEYLPGSSYPTIKEEKEPQNNSSRVICTHFYQKGMLSRELWRADMEYTLKHLPQSMVNGYHLWAIPYVRLMRKSPLAEKLMYPIAYHRAREIAYQMGYISKGSIRGKVFRAILEPICLFLGMFTKEHKYQELWRRA